jgi:hypothetical protein
MDSSVSYGLQDTFGVRDILFDRASFYTASEPQKRELVERTLDLVASEPDLFLHRNIEDKLFTILHEVARQDRGRPKN